MSIIRQQQFHDGLVIQADVTDQAVIDYVRSLVGVVTLIGADSPYGEIVDNPWDKARNLIPDLDLAIPIARQFADWLTKWTLAWSDLLIQGGAIYSWGGIGKPGFRPFYLYCHDVEEKSGGLVNLANHITWKKKRAYGIQHNYLFTREECAYFIKAADIKKPHCFNVPLLDQKRGYAGYGQDVIVGYFDGCYHRLAYGLHEDTSHPCMSSGAQTSSERIVYELLRQAEVSIGPDVSQTTTQELVQSKSRAPSIVRQETRQTESSSESAWVDSPKRQKERYSIRLEGIGSTGSVDERMPSVRNSDRRKQSAGEQLSVGGQDRQLCWVCTREHLHNVMAGQQIEDERDGRGTRNSSRLSANTTIEDVAIVSNQVKYPAKSEFLRRSNVWDEPATDDSFDSIWDVSEIFRGKIHKCQKPNRVSEIPIEVHTKPGEYVLDLFAGSGSLSAAARRLGRRWIAIEIGAAEFDTICTRMA